MPDYITTDGRTVTITLAAACGHCSETLENHIERALACPAERQERFPDRAMFRAWGGDDTLASPAPAPVAVTPAPLFTVGQRVSFNPPAYGQETGTVAEVQNARQPEYIEHAYVIADIDGNRVHRWENYGGESVAAMDAPEPAQHTLADAVARVGLHGQLLSAFGGTLFTVTSIEPILMRRESDGYEAGAWATGQQWIIVTTPATVAETPVETPEPPSVPATPRRSIPRDIDELAAMRAHAENVQEMFPTASAETSRYLRALTELETWLQGGKKQRAGHSLAGVEDPRESDALYDETGVCSIGLCGEYEAIVCTTFGWHPRRGETSSMMAHVRAWQQNVLAFEQSNDHLNATALIELWLTNYQPGGVFNMAVVDHIDGHLESHKVGDANELLEQFGWTTAPQERDYELRVRVTREYTVYEEAYVYLTRTATSDDEAIEGVDRYAVGDYLHNADWQTTDQSDCESWEIYEVELDN